MNPALTPDQVESLLTSTATDLGPVGWDETFGHGIINPLEALCGVGACEVVTAPSAPTSPTAVPGDQQVTVSWGAPVNNGGLPVTGYTVTVSPGGQVVDVGAGTTSTTVTGLTNGTAYTFAIRSVNSAGESPAANVQATPRTVPGAPQDVNASPGNGQMTVSWAAPASNGGSPVTGYTVTTSPGGQNVSVGAGVTSTTVTGLTNGTTYTFEVRAANAAGQGAAASVQATPVAVPGVPGNPTATPGDGQVTVSWTAPDPGGSPITGYTVTTTPGGQVQELDPGVTSTTITGLTNGTTYSFAIRAVNAVGQSTAANVQGTPRTVPGAPGNATAVPGDQQAVVSWTPPASDGGAAITGYTVTASPGGQSVTVGAAATSAVVTGLTNGTAYTFEVRASNAAGQGPAATTAPVTPTAPVVGEKVVRLAGADRYATAAEIARQFPAGVPVLYVASGQNFPDALAGAALAATRDAPVVLVRSGAIPSPTAQVLGEVETQLRAYATANTPDEVTRLQGADRYATAAAIARQFPAGVPVLYVASGQNFPDALAGAALAGSQGAPVLLVRSTGIPTATAKVLTDLTPQRVVVLGGPSSVSAAVADQLRAYATANTADEVIRLSGADRYATAAAIAARFPAGVERTYVASGQNFPDALAGAALAGSGRAPVVLVRAGDIPSASGNALTGLQPKQIVVLGGAVSVSEQVASQLAAYVQ